jgi:hypothetical protein
MSPEPEQLSWWWRRPYWAAYTNGQMLVGAVVFLLAMISLCLNDVLFRGIVSFYLAMAAALEVAQAFPGRPLV